MTDGDLKQRDSTKAEKRLEQPRKFKIVMWYCPVRVIVDGGSDPLGDGFYLTHKIWHCVQAAEQDGLKTVQQCEAFVGKGTARFVRVERVE